MQDNRFLLYGAYGYTGKLIARYSQQYGLEPILVGRRKELLEPLARQVALSYKVIDLDKPSELDDALTSVKAVLHAAGPFQYTARQMVEACMRTRTHYTDINGDIAVFEMLKQYDAAAKQSGIMVLPGAGFDVVPTDCISALLKNQLPDAISLQLAFATIGGGLSHGTASTMLNRLGKGGSVRKNGKIVHVPLGQKGFWVDFGERKRFVMSIPWGDISTAYFSTGIPNIETYAGVSPGIYRILKVQSAFNWLLRTSIVRNFIKRKIDLRPPGPSDETRARAKSLVWGKVENAKGETAIARLTGPDGYTLTTHSALLIIKKILEGKFSPGYQTPATAYGSNLIVEIPGVSRIS
jgi:short subunit dehydrogenase-like uncharacterized protein